MKKENLQRANDIVRAIERLDQTISDINQPKPPSVLVLAGDGKTLYSIQTATEYPTKLTDLACKLVLDIKEDIIQRREKLLAELNTL